MNTSEILVVLYEMKGDYETLPVKTKCKAGFCAWLMRFCGFDEDSILEELKKDKPDNGRFSYWYECYADNFDYEASITPRIDNLNRTITRLENELKLEQNGTL
jgi:hypothetical protein